MTKPVILTGLRANNDLHIGNYLGALLPMVDMTRNRAGDYQVNLMVADLHSFTTPIDHTKLYAQTMQNIYVYVAAGIPLDLDEVRIFRQSHVPAHSELTWILDCFTGMGEMARMTQFKDKSSKVGEDRINVGLFNYPVLMACDYLLYDATYVPVGEDQSQHLEFGRDIAARMNNKFNTELFTVPKPVNEQHEFFGKDQGLRIKDLVDPSKKMSKSDETGKGVIFLSDTPDVARKKIMSATTDSVGKINYDRAAQPGITNLLDLLTLFSGRALENVKAEFEGQEQYGPLKDAVATVIGDFLIDFQTKLSEVDEAEVLDKLESSEAAMRHQAQAVLLRTQIAVGLRPQAA